MAEQLITIRDSGSGESLVLPGVTSVTLACALLTEADKNEKTSGAVHHALNEPDRLTVAVTVTGTSVQLGQTAAGILSSLTAMKRERRLLRVAAPLAVYTGMLLTGITVMETGECPDGWTGELVFQQSEAINKKKKTVSGSGRRGAVGDGDTRILNSLPLV